MNLKFSDKVLFSLPGNWASGRLTATNEYGDYLLAFLWGKKGKLIEAIDKKAHKILASSRVNIEDYAFRAQNGSMFFWKEEQGKIKKHRLALIL